jgi:hypothetical protein
MLPTARILFAQLVVTHNRAMSPQRRKAEVIGGIPLTS